VLRTKPPEPALQRPSEGQVPLLPGPLIQQRNRPIVVEHDHCVDELNPVFAEVPLGSHAYSNSRPCSPCTVYTIAAAANNPMVSGFRGSEP
jgi:hypothetical protein